MPGSDTLDVKVPTLKYRAMDGSRKNVVFKKFSDEADSMTINRDALIAAHVRIKPYITPNGAYGTTYAYVAGSLIANGPARGDQMEFSDYDHLLAPPAKKLKST